MFPYPVCDGDMCELQDTLTEEHGAVFFNGILAFGRRREIMVWLWIF